jgi:hypothetical protein
LGNVIGTGQYSRVYRCTFTNTKGCETEMAIKSFNPINCDSTDKSIERDIQHGTDPRLRSEYTIIYQEGFGMSGCFSVSMPLMKMSLDKYIQSQNLLSDDVLIDIN